MAARTYDCLQGDLGAGGYQQIRLSTQQFGGTDKWAARVVDGTIFNDNVLSFAKTVLFQLRRKRPIEIDLHWGCAFQPEKSYSGEFLGLLCASTKRPRCHCAA